MRGVDKYFTEWDEDSPITWRSAGRKQLNVIIRIVNEWTIDGCPDGHSAKILRRIEMGTETFAAQDGGSAWAKELDEMRDYVQERCEDEQA